MAKKRSPAYPAFDLSRAIGRAKQIYADNHGGWASQEALASVFNYSTSSSGLRQAISTMLQFDLLEEKGAAEPRMLRLSAVGRNLVVREPESPEYLAALRQAALNPRLHREIYDRYNGVLPPGNQALRTYLLVEREPSFHPDHVDGFIRQLRATFDLARLGGADSISDESAGDEPNEGEGRAEPMNQAATMERPVAVAQPAPQAPQRASGSQHLFDDDSASMTLNLPKKNFIEVRLAKRVTEAEFKQILTLLDQAKFSFTIETDEYGDP